MKEYNFIKNFRRIHFVGIGGISMSALAKLCLSYGKSVSGSDKAQNEILNELEHLGAKIFHKHSKKNVLGADLVVYTCAVGENNEEVLFAKQLGLPVFERAEFLGKISNEYKNVIAVAGSHGKTTTCGMIFNIFKSANKNPTLMVGGETNFGNLVIGDKYFLIVEACEYMEHFLKLNVSTSVILNIDFDHPDYFKTQKNYQNAFVKFSNLSKNNIIIDEKYSIILKEQNDNCNTPKEVLTFGTNGNYVAKHIVIKENFISFDVYKNKKYFLHIKLNLIGAHNVLNALCAVATADSFFIDKQFIKSGIESFDGVKRRYEYMGKLGSNMVIADYAHHPTQVENAIKATKQVFSKDVTIVFEPHTYSRTKAFLSSFADSLSLADRIIILPTYSARERIIKGGTSRDLFETTKKLTDNVLFLKSKKKCLRELKKLSNNIILILGAGSIYNLAKQIKSNYIQSLNEEDD